MAKSSSTSSSNRWPWALIAAIGLVIVIQVAALHCPALWRFLLLYSTPLNDDPVRVEATLRLLEEPKTGYRVIITGSSQAREDIDVDRLNEAFAGKGVEIVNLGISGGGPPIDMYMLADRMIAAEPDLVIYMPYFGSFFQAKYDYLKMRYYFDAAILPWLKESVGLGDFFEKREVPLDVLLSRVFYLFRYREFIQRIERSFVDSLARGEIRDAPAMFALKEPQPPEFYAAKLSSRTNAWYSNTDYHGLNTSVFRAFVEKLRDEDIPLIVVDGPTHPLIHQTYEGELPVLYANLLSKASRDTGCRVIGPDDLPPFPAAEFGDFTHLNAEGRVKMTQVIEDLIRSSRSPVSP